MEIKPATMAMVQRGRGGRLIAVDEDVLDVARGLKEIDPRLSLHFNENGGYFVVVETLDNGDEKLVLTAQELGPNILDRVRKLASPDHDYVKEVEQLDRQAERDKDHAFHEQTGEVGERLAHALRKDLQAGNKIFIPRSI